MRIAIFCLTLLGFCGSVAARVNLGDIASAISCNSNMNRQWWTTELRAVYGQPRQEQGALWFKAKGERLYGQAVDEIFISADPWHRFVGVTFRVKPEAMLNQIKTDRIYPTKVFASPPFGWVGADGRHIMWHAGKNTKIFCTGVQQRKYE